jgi:hypothetical protein
MALYLAVKNGHIEIVKLLLEHGADLNTKANGCVVLLELAKCNAHTKFLVEENDGISCSHAFRTHVLSQLLGRHDQNKKDYNLFAIYMK